MGARQCKEMKVALDLVQFPLSGYFAAYASGVTKGALYRSADYKKIKNARDESGVDVDSYENCPVPQVNENPTAVADILEKVNTVTNDGRGSKLCEKVIASLRNRDIDNAIKLASNDSTHVNQHPNLLFVFERTGLI